MDPKVFDARKTRLKFLMAAMLVFMVAAPLLDFFYIATPAVFGGLFLQNLIFYRRWVRKNKDTQ